MPFKTTDRNRPNSWNALSVVYWAAQNIYTNESSSDEITKTEPHALLDKTSNSWPLNNDASVQF